MSTTPGRSGGGPAGPDGGGKPSGAGGPDGVESLDFESAVAEVEDIIQGIESGEVGLEKSLAEYERGVALLKRCKALLERAEQRVHELTSQMQAEVDPSKGARGRSPGGETPGGAGGAGGSRLAPPPGRGG